MTFSLLEFAKFLGEMAEKAEEPAHRELDKAARIVQRRAKKDIGHYQQNTGPFASWAPLAASTIADKQRQGYAPPDSPLLREGNLRDSIERRVEGNEAVVGSDSEVAVFQELGTQTIPPRSFLGVAAFQEAEAVAHVLGRGFMQRIVPKWRGNWQPPGPDREFEREMNRATRAAEMRIETESDHAIALDEAEEEGESMLETAVEDLGLGLIE